MPSNLLMSLNKSGHSGHPNQLMESLNDKRDNDKNKTGSKCGDKIVIKRHQKISKNDNDKVKLLNHDLLEFNIDDNEEPIVLEPDLIIIQRAESEILSILPQSEDNGFIVEGQCQSIK